MSPMRGSRQKGGVLSTQHNSKKGVTHKMNFSMMDFIKLKKKAQLDPQDDNLKHTFKPNVN